MTIIILFSPSCLSWAVISGARFHEASGLEAVWHLEKLFLGRPSQSTAGGVAEAADIGFLTSWMSEAKVLAGSFLLHRLSLACRWLSSPCPYMVFPLPASFLAAMLE